MTILYILSWISLLLLICVGLISTAAGLFYLAELVEEYTVVAKKVITWIIFSVILFYFGLLIFDSFPIHVVIFGLLSQVAYLCIMKNFPNLDTASISFGSAMVLLVIDHYVALGYFGVNPYPLSEMIAYFILCIWIVPFCLIVSLSANEYVLPVANSSSPLLGDDNVVSKYFSSKGKRYGLLYFFNYVKDSIFDGKNKKLF